MDNNWLELLSDTNQLATVMETNQYVQQFGLTLSEQDAQLILDNRKAALRTQHRIEFGEGIVPKIIREFCDSPYIDQNAYAKDRGRFSVQIQGRNVIEPRGQKPVPLALCEAYDFFHSRPQVSSAQLYCVIYSP